ncbi:CHAD domain-containing protein [bacterium]|nr:CHAD domain-containing protein [bacterium]
MTTRFQQWKLQFERIKRRQTLSAVHDFRVATRRLRAAITIFSPYLNKHSSVPFDQFKKFARLCGIARDLDVTIEHIAAYLPKISIREQKGVQYFLESYRTKRRQEGLKITDQFSNANIDLIENVFNETIKLSIMTAPELPDLRALSRQVIGSKIMAVYEFDVVCRRPLEISALHEMRIAVKHLRYVLEVFDNCFDKKLRPFIDTCKLLQDQLGSIHDGDVMIEALRSAIKKFSKSHLNTWLSLIQTVETIDETKILIDSYKQIKVQDVIPGLIKLSVLRMNERVHAYNNFIKFWSQYSIGFKEELQNNIENGLS